MTVLLVPRGGSWGASVAAAAAEAGLVPWVLPIIETLPAPSDELTAALARVQAGYYDWLAVTSAAAVPALAQGVPAATRVAAVGAATEHALVEAGIRVDLVGQAGAEHLVTTWPQTDGSGRVLAVQSDLARPVLIDGLAAAGWQVDAVVAYRTAATRLSTSEEHALRTGKADIALVTSGSVGRRLAQVGVPERTRIVAIGEQTAIDCRESGLSVARVSPAPSVTALVQAAQEVSCLS